MMLLAWANYVNVRETERAVRLARGIARQNGIIDRLEVRITSRGVSASRSQLRFGSAA